MNANQKSIIIAGLGFGDEGKGSVVDFLVRHFGAKTVIRYNGGAQAAHNVTADDGRHHTFAQFGSGTFAEGVKTHLSDYMLVNPLNMIKEENHLAEIGIKDSFPRTIISEKAIVITPFHIAANRLTELSRGKDKEGTCGLGVGQALRDFLAHGDKILIAKDLKDRALLKEKLRFIRRLKLAWLKSLPKENVGNALAQREIDALKNNGAIDWLADKYLSFSQETDISNGGSFEDLDNETVIFEGAQGVLLDPKIGFHPYITSTRTTFKNAEKLLKQNDCSGKIIRLGVLRAYSTRHGAGPFVTEDKYLAAKIPDWHNGNNPWQGAFRIGWFDLVAAKYALEATGKIDGLALTNLDRLNGFAEIKICAAYQYNGEADRPTLDYFFEWEKESGETVIRKIRAAKNAERQGELARLLFDCRPVYKNLPGWDFCGVNKFPGPAQNYVEFLEQELKTPIVLLSVSPSASGKIWRGRD